MTKINKIDKLFALKGVEKKIHEAVTELDSECASDLLRAYEEEGTTQRRSQFFGKEAGTYSLVLPKEETKEEWAISDNDAFIAWIESESGIWSLQSYAIDNAEAVASWLLGSTGEIPGGMERKTYTVVSTSKPRLSVKADVVIDKLGANFLEATNHLLLEGGSDGVH